MPRPIVDGRWNAKPGFFAWLESNIAALLRRDPDALEHAIRRCCEIKAEVVAEDEREAGRRLQADCR